MKSAENMTVFPCSGICLGIDPVVDDFEAHSPSSRRQFESRLEAHARVLERTDRHFAIKPNVAFFMRFGSWGIGLLEAFCARMSPDFPILLDGKFSEIQNSLKGYLDFAFGTLRAQAVTVNPFLGEGTIRLALESCLEHTAGFGRVYVLCATSEHGVLSSEGAGLGRLQDVGAIIAACREIEAAAGLSQEHSPLGLVVGAGRQDVLTRPDLLAAGLPLLCPGLGAQGASWSMAKEFLHHQQEACPSLFPVSRFVFDGGRSDPDLGLQRIQEALDLLGCGAWTPQRSSKTSQVLPHPYQKENS